LTLTFYILIAQKENIVDNILMIKPLWA